MTAAAVKPGVQATALVSRERKAVTIIGWSEDKVHVIVRVQTTGNQLYRTPRELKEAK